MSGRTLEPRGTVVQVAGKNIAELANMDIAELYEFLSQVETKLDKKVGPLLMKF